jgi:hypothetical protein
MKNSVFAEVFLIAALAGSTVTAWSQNAPGEDPVILNKRVTVQMLPIGGGKPSSPMQNGVDMPAWLKAKVARYEAKFNSEQTAGMATDADVTRTASSDGPAFRKWAATRQQPRRTAAGFRRTTSRSWCCGVTS